MKIKKIGNNIIELTTNSNKTYLKRLTITIVLGIFALFTLEINYQYIVANNLLTGAYGVILLTFIILTVMTALDKKIIFSSKITADKENPTILYSARLPKRVRVEMSINKNSVKAIQVVRIVNSRTGYETNLSFLNLIVGKDTLPINSYAGKHHSVNELANTLSDTLKIKKTLVKMPFEKFGKNVRGYYSKKVN